MGQGPYRQKVDPGFGVSHQIIPSNVTAGLGGCIGTQPGHCFTQGLDAKIIQQNSINPAGRTQHLKFLHRSDFKNDRQVQKMALQVGANGRQGRCHTTAGIDVVVLDQYGIVQTKSMVDTPAPTHRFLLDQPVQRRGFAGIQQTARRMFNGLGPKPGPGGDATHSLHDVQQKALGL